MKRINKIIYDLRYKGALPYLAALLVYRSYRYLKYDRLTDIEHIQKRFQMAHGYAIDLDSPRTLNEKLQWLKLHDRRPEQRMFADKYLVRSYASKALSESLLPPLLLYTLDYRDIRPDVLPDEPFIVKATHDSGSYVIVRDKSLINWDQVRVDFRWSLSHDYFFVDREWQYLGLTPGIVVEKLLLNSQGKIPNDYKVNCINGKAVFVYCSIDREGSNSRNIYDINWNPLGFTWARKEKDISKLRSVEIEPPESLRQMIEIAEKIARYFPYVRVDFYDVDGKLYLGEVTQCHGGGYDRILPFEWDLKWGDLLNLDLSHYQNMSLEG